MKTTISACRIRQILSETGMKQQELADKAGITKGSISQYVNGIYTPNTINAEKISSVTGYNPLWIMGFDVAPDAPLTHTQTVSLSLDEEEIIRAYRFADELTRAMVQRTLGIEKKKEVAQVS